MESAEEIAQWVINNRYPKSENDKLTDSEMYQEIIALVETYAQRRYDDGYNTGGHAAATDILS